MLDRSYLRPASDVGSGSNDDGNERAGGAWRPPPPPLPFPWTGVGYEVVSAPGSCTATGAEDLACGGGGAGASGGGDSGGAAPQGALRLD
eukprot:358574-Chlamydomonas_euryale.AAC.6